MQWIIYMLTLLFPFKDFSEILVKYGKRPFTDLGFCFWPTAQRKNLDTSCDLLSSRCFAPMTVRALYASQWHGDFLSSVQCCIWTGELCSYLKLLDCDWNLCFSEEWRQASGLSLSQPQAFNFKDTDVSAVLRFSRSDDFIIVKCSWTRPDAQALVCINCKSYVADWSLNGKPTKFTCQRKSPPRQYRSPSLKKCSKCHCIQQHYKHFQWFTKHLKNHKFWCFY